ncbi:MAG: carboxynorspermidine decarboxylase [bacterium]
MNQAALAEPGPAEDFGPSQCPSPSFVVDEAQLNRNLAILDEVQQRTGARVLLALKGFAMWPLFPGLRRVLRGASASSLHEARLASEEFGGELHVYAPAYRDDEFDALLGYADHLIFNSFTQWARFKDRVSRASPPVRCGVRVNARQSEVKTPLYDPSAPGSRLGIPVEAFTGRDLEGITGLHVHNLCELGADALERTLAAVERQFGAWLPQMQWVNFGGGHHITRPGYDLDHLCRIINDFRKRYPIPVYLEPGEAVALNAGVLVTSVLDIVHNAMEIAILDCSAAAHMPDVLEMPYRPQISGAGAPGEFPHTYRLGGLTCLAGDVIGDYSFPEPLRPGMRLVFLDMAHYTMVKTTMFNGVNLPDICVRRAETGRIEVLRHFAYEDYRGRLG